MAQRIEGEPEEISCTDDLEDGKARVRGSHQGGDAEGRQQCMDYAADIGAEHRGDSCCPAAGHGARQEQAHVGPWRDEQQDGGKRIGKQGCGVGQEQH